MINLRRFSSNTFQTHISAKDLCKVSDEIARDYSPVPPVKPLESFKTSLSTEELLEVSQNISRYYAPKIVSNNKNITLLAVDPQHIYIYWNLGDRHDNSLLQSMSTDNIVLRIYSQPEHARAHTPPQPLLEIPIHNIQYQKKIRVATAKKNIVYSAYIGKCPSKNDFISLVKSNELHVFKGTSPITSTFSNTDAFNNKESLFDMIHIHPLSTAANHYAASNHSGQGYSQKLQ